MSLALDYRPDKIDDIFGQHEIKAIFREFIKKEKIPNSIFFGPAGSGKTTLAKVLANELNYTFYELDASNLKVEDIRKILNMHENSLYKPLIFIDEIHRLSKNQQEILLIPLENQKAVIIGATTENPQFVLTSGIRSRCMFFEFKALTNTDLRELFEKVQKSLNFTIGKEAKNYLISSSGGDARAMFNLLDFALLIDENISLKTLKTLRANSIAEGANSDDTHYQIISAFIKSIRGSDIDAAIYYLARMLENGESPDFIARRLMILSAEDVGNANPHALNIAASTLFAVSKIGMPEAGIILAQCVVYLVSSPKSNSSYKAINGAIDFVRNNENFAVPSYLINTSKERENYLYPHDFGGWVKQNYTSKPVKFYESKGIGFEKTLNEWIEKIKNK